MTASTPGLSLRRQLLIWLLLPQLVLWAGGGLLAYRIALSYAEKGIDQSLTQSVRALARQVKPIGSGLLIDFPRAAQDVLEQDPDDRISYMVSSPPGQFLLGNQRLPQPRQPGQVAEQWPPLMVIQGESDPIVSPRNGAAAAQFWADGVGAGSGVQRSVQRGQRYPMTVTDFKQRGRTVVTLVSIARLGHAWSGGAASQSYSDPKGPDATRMAWAFVSRQFRQLAQADPSNRRATLAR